MTLHLQPPEAMTPAGPRPRAESLLRARFASHGGRTERVRVHEAGVLRLRLPRQTATTRVGDGSGRDGSGREGLGREDLGRDCEGVIINTGGGVLGGDRQALAFDLGPDADVVLTTVAAEKIYRAEGPPATIATTLSLGPQARLDWLPQETILFDRARLVRGLQIEMAPDATLLAAEMLVFGRLAMGETAITGTLRDGWRLRRGGRLVFADETRLEGDMGAILDRPALGAAARAAALIVFAAPDGEARLEPLRAALAPYPGLDSGASAFHGILVARLVARSPEVLRAAMVAALRLLRGRPLPRVWQSNVSGSPS